MLQALDTICISICIIISSPYLIALAALIYTFIIVSDNIFAKKHGIKRLAVIMLPLSK